MLGLWNDEMMSKRFAPTCRQGSLGPLTIHHSPERKSWIARCAKSPWWFWSWTR